MPLLWQEMKEFHTEEYIDFLLKITPDNMHEMSDRMKQHNVGFVGQYDCPVFDGIFPFCQVFICYPAAHPLPLPDEPRLVEPATASRDLIACKPTSCLR